MKVNGYLFVGFILFLSVGVYFVQAHGLGKTVADAKSFGHNADEIIVHIAGSDYNLQDAIDNNRLMGTNLVGGTISPGSLVYGHSADDLLVKVSGVESNLQDAIDSGTLCSNTDNSDYVQQTPNPGHAGYDVWITNITGNEELFQEAIDNREFCSCGNNICEDGTNGNVNYGESSANCANDCAVAPPSVIEQDLSCINSGCNVQYCTINYNLPDGCTSNSVEFTATHGLYWFTGSGGALYKNGAVIASIGDIYLDPFYFKDINSLPGTSYSLVAGVFHGTGNRCVSSTTVNLHIKAICN